MASLQEIAAWKSLYGEIYVVGFKGKEYIYRALTFEEYDNILATAKFLSGAQQEDLIVQAVLLEPSGSIDKIPAGAIGSIAESVLENSGFSSAKRAKQLLDKRREEMYNVRTTMFAMVLDAIRSYREEDLLKLNFSQLCKLVVYAEEIIKIRQTYANPDVQVTFELSDPEEEAQKKAEAERKAAEKARKAAERMGRVDPDAPPPIKPTIRDDDPVVAKLRAALG